MKKQPSFINGSLVQLVRTPACHAGGQRFKSATSRQIKDTYSKYFCKWFVKPVVVGSSPAFQVFENSSTGRARVKMRVSCIYGGIT